MSNYLKLLILSGLLFLIFSETYLSQEYSLRSGNLPFLKGEKLTWLGIDFSLVQLIGKLGFKDPQKMRDQYFSAINLVVINEPKKYNLREVFNKYEVLIDLTIVDHRNLQVDLEELVFNTSREASLINESDIQLIVDEYEFSESEGIGLVFIMQKLDKSIPKPLGTMFVTFIDFQTKKVLLTEKMSGRAGGFGMRNYWVRTVKNVLNDIEDYNINRR